MLRQVIYTNENIKVLYSPRSKTTLWNKVCDRWQCLNVFNSMTNHANLLKTTWNGSNCKTNKQIQRKCCQLLNNSELPKIL